MVTWVKEEWNGKPFFLCVYNHSVLHTLILVIAPYLQKYPMLRLEYILDMEMNYYIIHALKSNIVGWSIIKILKRHVSW